VNAARNSDAAAIPPRADWPEPVPQTEAGALLTDVVLTTFRLNARLMEAAQELGPTAGLPPLGGRCSAESLISPAAWLG
jgi:hypothetical protein